jgi:multidrug efflux pump subunit AcrA (membrane-fusion protein)
MRAPLLFCVAFLLAACQRQEPAPVPTAPKPAPVAPVVLAAPPAAAAVAWPEAVGLLQGSGETPVLTRVAGFLVKQTYVEGELVKAGHGLFVLDPNTSHVSTDAVTRGAKTITIDAPADGVAGRAQHGAGDWLEVGTVLTTLQTCDPMRAEFSLPAGTKAPDVKSARVRLSLPDGTRYDREGQVVSVLAGKDGTLAISASFPNPHGQLKPGEYVKIQAAPDLRSQTNAPSSTWR